MPISSAAGPMVIGHRGASGHRPEHTAAAYRLAIASGADAVEPDVVVSRDGVLVVRHENELSGTTDVAGRPEFAAARTRKTVDGVARDGWFAEDFTWAELAALRAREPQPGLRPRSAAHDGDEGILRLRDVLALVDDAGRRTGREPAVVIELKHVEFLRAQGHDPVALLLAELAACGWGDRPGRLFVECFELDPLDRLREAGLREGLVLLVDHAGVPADQAARLGEAARAFAWYRGEAGLRSLAGRVDGISVDKRDLLADPGLRDRTTRHGLTLFAWTLRPENRFLEPAYRRGDDPSAWGDWRAEWAAVLSRGVDGVFVDHPDLLGALSGEA